MKITFRVSLRPLIVAVALFAHSVSSFHAGTSVMAPSSPLARGRSASSVFSTPREASSVLSLRGGASTRASPLHAVAVDALAVVNNFFQTSPYLAAALTCGTKASAADYVAQRRHFHKRGETNDLEKKWDTARNIAFLVYGAIYQGMAQEFIYNHLYPVWFGTGASVGVVLKKVLFDLMIQTTMVTLPIAYLTKAAIFRYPAQEGMRRYWEDIYTNGLLKKYFLLWGPVQCITFSVVPEHLRVSFIAVVSFFWLIILSSVSARPRKASTTNVRGGGEVQQQEIQECVLVDGVTCNIDG